MSEAWAVTVHQPWAYALTWWGKDCENRIWEPSGYGIGAGDKIVIHAGRLRPPNSAPRGGKAWDAMMSQIELLNADGVIPGGPSALCKELSESLLRNSSALVAIATIDRIATKGDDDFIHESPWRTDDEFAWVVRDVCPIVPIPCNGKEKLWQLTETQKEQVNETCRACVSCGVGYRDVIRNGHGPDCSLRSEFTAPWVASRTDPRTDETVPF